MASEAPRRLAPSVSLTYLGVEKQPVVVIDNFVADPGRLIADASARDFSKIGPYYPGIRAPAPAAYLSESADLLEKVLREIFGFQTGAALLECNHSLVTTRPEDLSPVQRLPHYDSTDPGRIALLHYLCGRELGGTRFFRHRASGFETITTDRFEFYKKQLHTETGESGLPPASYVGKDTPQFEEIALCEAAFNRALVYRGITLHSGAIPEGLAFSSDPAVGRLTVNSFFQARG